ncbi:MAG: DTW domain-containing protein [Marinobacterium sp.]|nr:DTW domain-containing protein [Marinobacterium sp.]
MNKRFYMDSNIQRDHCSHCTLATDYCICRHAQPQQTEVQLALLLHANEPLRPTGTASVIKQTLPDTRCFIWQRTSPPQTLLQMIKDPTYQPWLIFPADRPELEPRQKTWHPSKGRTPLLIIPDGTWKEVRKMVRKSPWLTSLPLLAFSPQQPSRYRLRRNPDAEHLCTAEVASHLLTLTGHPDAAQAIDQQLTHFLTNYHLWQHHLPASATMPATQAM